MSVEGVEVSVEEVSVEEASVEEASVAAVSVARLSLGPASNAPMSKAPNVSVGEGNVVPVVSDVPFEHAESANDASTDAARRPRNGGFRRKRGAWSEIMMVLSLRGAQSWRSRARRSTD